MYMETFQEYEKGTEEMKFGSGNTHMPGLVFWTLALCGEAGELAEKVKKIYRDNNGCINAAEREGIIKECGDVLWYLTRVAAEVNCSLGGVARKNVLKLMDRQRRGVQQGSGDDR